MTQAQIDLQTQLEQATPTDLITRPLSNDSPVLYFETSEQTPPTFLKQMEHTKVEHENSKPTLSQDDTDHTQPTPPPPKKRYEIIKDPIFLSSPKYPPSIPSKISLCTNRDDHLIPILSTDDFVFKAQLTSLYLHPTDYSFSLYDKNQDFFTSIASKIRGPYHYWLDNGVKIFSLQFNFLRPSIYDLKTDESDPSFLSIAQKATHHQTYTNFLQYTKPQNHIFCQLQIYITVHNDKYSRPLIVPQEFLIHYDDFLLPCNIPTQIAKPLTVIKHLVPSPLDDKDRTYYTALYKQTYSYNELLFISAKTISFMVQAEQKLNINHTLHLKNAPDKLSSVLNNRTLRDMTNLLDPYKRNSSETPITTLTHILHCYDRKHKLLQTLNLDSQRITQSSQAIQSALETITTLFNSTNLH